ncbi:MAG: transposase [Alphaproteobacteria bacterium]|nr:transposase [Alphaproteobacteria bacterium]
MDVLAPQFQGRCRAWLRWYNHHRPHGALAGSPPISRLPHST